MYGWESWTVKKAEHRKNWCLQNVVLEKTLESPLNCTEIKPVNSKGNQPLLIIERTDAEAEAQYFGHLMQSTNSLGKTLMLGKTEGRRTKGWQDKMVGWHHWLNAHEFEQSLGDGGGQGSLECCSPWGQKESDTTEQLNNNNFYRNISAELHWFNFWFFNNG